MRFQRFGLLALCLSVSAGSFATISLPAIFSDNMVVQRERPFRVWGRAEPGEKITVTFYGKPMPTVTRNDGSFQVVFGSMNPTARPGILEIAGEGERVRFVNIVIGDVWIAGGQSNMEFPVGNVKNAAAELAGAAHPAIRLFTVAHQRGYTPVKDVEGRWKVCDSATVRKFSAVAYFFARRLQEDLQIPIGIVNSSWGGTNIQTWISWEGTGHARPFRKINPAEYGREVADRQKKFNLALRDDAGSAGRWAELDSFPGWRRMAEPASWKSGPIGRNDGTVWFGKEFDRTDSGGAVLHLGTIDDEDSTFVNGHFVGHTDDDDSARVYAVDSSFLRPGRNVVVVKITAHGNPGGFSGNPADLWVGSGGHRISLAGEWRYKPSVLSSEFGYFGDGPNAFPAQLYNGMIAPLTKVPVKGIIWYQGESNTDEARAYRYLLGDLIRDWRRQWGTELPFLWVQLPNFGPAAQQPPAESDWASLREAQSMNLVLPRTAQAVTIDVGEANDIHPKNKQMVGRRLAIAAETLVYDSKAENSGPVYQDMKVDGNFVTVSFTHATRGLDARGGDLRGFALAGIDGKWAWADARIEGNRVVVSSAAVPQPVNVRYAWADNPEGANLYNFDGLPASPFRSDTIKGYSSIRSFDKFRKVPQNPLLGADSSYTFDDPFTGKPVRWQRADVFNPGAVLVDNKVQLLLRCEDNPKAILGGRTSRLGLAVSIDGLQFVRFPKPVLYPQDDDFKKYDFPGGCEDPRVVETPEHKYVVVYTSWNGDVARLSAAVSRDLIHWEKKGPVFAATGNPKLMSMWSKSGSILTKLENGRPVAMKLGGHYWMYWGENFVNIAWSDNLTDWNPTMDADGNLKRVIGPRDGYFDSQLTECGPPALWTAAGIVLLYNGKNAEDDRADTSIARGTYSVGQVLLDPNEPGTPIARTDEPFLRPSLPHEVTGQYKAGTTFAEGLVHFRNRWWLYYGTADSYVGLAVSDEDWEGATGGSWIPWRK